MTILPSFPEMKSWHTYPNKQVFKNRKLSKRFLPTSQLCIIFIDLSNKIPIKKKQATCKNHASPGSCGFTKAQCAKLKKIHLINVSFSLNRFKHVCSSAFNRCQTTRQCIVALYCEQQWLGWMFAGRRQMVCVDVCVSCCTVAYQTQQFAASK